MANYFIIGGDGKQYGPITDADLCKWIEEGRLNQQSLAKGESDAEFRPLSTFPEFADALGTLVPAPGAALPSAGPVDWSRRDYDLDIGDCISRGWNLFKDNFGTLFGGFLLFILIVMAGGGVFNGIAVEIIPKPLMNGIAFRQCFNIVYQIVIALLAGPLTGGLYYVMIQRIRGQPAGVGDLFVGFQRAFPQLFLGQFMVSLFVGLFLIPYNIVIMTKMQPLLEQFQHPAPGEIQTLFSELFSAFAATLPIFVLSMIPVTYLTVNWIFTLPLIIDRQMDFWSAMWTSWRMVHKHWWTVFGLVVVAGLVSLGGFLACCIGALFTAPIALAACMCGYETIFGESRAA